MIHSIVPTSTIAMKRPIAINATTYRLREIPKIAVIVCISKTVSDAPIACFARA